MRRSGDIWISSGVADRDVSVLLRLVGAHVAADRDDGRGAWTTEVDGLVIRTERPLGQEALTRTLVMTPDERIRDEAEWVLVLDELAEGAVCGADVEPGGEDAR